MRDQFLRKHPKKFDDEYKRKLGDHQDRVAVIMAILFTIVIFGSAILWGF